MSDAHIDGVWHRLKSLSFVRHSTTGDDIALHDEMRRMVLRWCWGKQTRDSTGLQQQELSTLMITYYKQEIAREQSPALRQAYQAEMLYHLLYLEKAQGFTPTSPGFAFFLEQMQRALDLRQYTYTRSLLQEASEFEDDLLPEQRYSLLEQEARLLQNEEKYESALERYELLLHLEGTPWLQEHHADLLYERGICFTRLRHLPEAIYSLTRSLEIYEAQQNEKRIALTYGRIGYAYYKQGDLETAIKYYDHSLKLHRGAGNQVGYADILNSLGMVYAMQGKLSQASHHCHIALRYRREFYKEQEVSEVSVAISLRTLGDVYYRLGDATQARQCFQQAYDIYERYADQQGMASTSNYFGQLALDEGSLTEANEWFQKAARLASHFDPESEIRSLNRQSRVLFKQRKEHEAIELMQQAIEQAEQIRDFHQQTESLVELARMLRRASRLEEAQQALTKAELLARRYNYFYLLGDIMYIQGDACYSDGRNEEAFRFYTLYCYSMAHYTLEAYHKAVRQTLDYLIDLPQDRINQIWHQLSNDWAALELDEEQQRFMEQELEEVRAHLEL